MAESAFAPWSGSSLLAAPSAPAPRQPPPGHAGQGCSIYIKGMPEDADKLWLYEKFSRFGGILSVRVLVDDHTGRCNGIGFVNFTGPEASRAAHETMNGVGMGDRLLHVMIQSATAGNSGRTSRAHSHALHPMDRAPSYPGGPSTFGGGW
jgi:RNA recognition motif-containing protein